MVLLDASEPAQQRSALHTVKEALAMTALAFGLVGCGRNSDAQLIKQLPGTWVVTGTNVNGGIFTSTITIGKSGDYGCRIVSRYSGSNIISSAVQGVFQVEKGVLIDTVTNHSNTNSRLPMITRARIVHFGGNEMVLRAEPNQQIEVPTDEVVFRKVSP